MITQPVRWRNVAAAGRPGRIEADSPIAAGRAGTAVAHRVQPHGKPGYRTGAVGGIAREGRRWSTWKPRDSAVARDLPSSRWDWDEADWRALRGEELGWLAEAAASRTASQN
jgi:hypothetical protein